ncbi:MAG: zinc-ribbon domain-containing protein [Magnetococcales bacterium]|nr:zinc-ribbon domain-containing protein [Magnetococcales bacterium]
MIVQCENCSSRFDVDDRVLLPLGRKLRCSMCKHVFFQMPPTPEAQQSAGEIDTKSPAGSPSGKTPSPAAASASAAKAPKQSDPKQVPAPPQVTTAPAPPAEPASDGDVSDVSIPSEVSGEPAPEEAAAAEAAVQEGAGLTDEDLDLDLDLEQADDPERTPQEAEDASPESGPEPGSDPDREPDMETDLEGKPDLDASDFDLDNVDDLLLDEEDQASNNKRDGSEKSLESLLDEMNSGELLHEEGEEDVATVLSQLSGDLHKGKSGAPSEEEDQEPVFDDLSTPADSGEDLKEIVLDDFPDEKFLENDGVAKGSMLDEEDLSRYEEVDLDDDTRVSARAERDEAEQDGDADLAALALQGKPSGGQPNFVADVEPEPQPDENLAEEEEEAPRFPFETPKVRKILLWTSLFLAGLWVFGLVSSTEWFEYRIYSMSHDIHLAAVESHWRTTRDGEPMLLLEGKLRNATKMGQKARKVRVSLLDKENKPLQSVQIVPGRVLKESDFDISDESLHVLVGLQADTRQVKTIPTIKADSDIGFQAIFLNPSGNAVRFKVDLDDAKESSDKPDKKDAKDKAVTGEPEKKAEKSAEGAIQEKQSGKARD